MESKGFFYYLRKNEQKSSKQRIKIIEHEIDKMEKGNLNNLDYKQIITLEAELDDIHDKKNKRGTDKIKVKMNRRGRKKPLNTS